MKLLAIYNLKGGVGKTAAAVNLAHMAARDGGRVLLWDLDPQGAASFYLRVKPKLKGGAKAVLSPSKPVADLVKESDFQGLDLLPADFSLRRLDARLAGSARTDHVRRFLAPLADSYDVAVLDCPPSIGHMADNIFTAADALASPLLPSPLSLRSYEQLSVYCERKGHPVPRLPFFSMVDRRKSLHRTLVASGADQLAGLLPTQIPYASQVERMGVERAPVTAFAPRSQAALAFASLWQDLAERLFG